MEFQPSLTLLAFAALLLTAVGCDLRTRRIPNALVGLGIALGLLFQTLAPIGEGLFAAPGTALGLVSAIVGALVGLALFLPFYAMRVMGAGDVKLLAMVGVWLGAHGVAWAALWTLAAGGAMALAVALATGVLRQVLYNVRVMCAASLRRMRGDPGLVRTTGRLPYALAIVCGTAAELVRQLMHASA